MIYIYYSFISENYHKKLMQEFLLRFPIDFQNKIKNYRRWQDAQSSLLGRILLNAGVDNFNVKYKEIDIRYTKYKKPYLGDEDVCFNISHSGEIVVCAVTNVCDIGIDIELQRNIQVEDFKHQMTDTEWSKISTASNKMDSFYNYWTQKEAVIKGCGKGLFIPLNSFEIYQNSTNIDNEKFFLTEIKLGDDYKCHIATNTLINEACIKISEFNASNYYTNLI